MSDREARTHSSRHDRTLEVLEDVARLGARLIMQTALEAEVAEFLGRARDQRRSEAPEARAGPVRQS